jgi:3-dehydroquinate dehydratase/shikimate dehydrogenase
VSPLTDEVVPRIGAANTLVHGAEGWRAYNTDAQAALESLLAHVPPTPEGPHAWLKARGVMILGAGGAARALAFALSDKVGMLTVTSRTPEHAAQLATQANCRVVDWVARHNVLCDLVINCTSVGMFPNVDESPLHASFLRPELMVFDIVYTPETTLLVKEARTRGCHVLTGVDMFVRQAALQFKLFTGQEPPPELMMQVVRRILSPVAIRDEEAPKPAPDPTPAPSDEGKSGEGAGSPSSEDA